MSAGLRDHEADLQRALRRLERATPFAEVMAERSLGESVQSDSKSLTVHKSPRVAGAIFRAWAGNQWAEAAASGLDSASIAAAVDGLETRLASATRGSPPPGESSTTVGAVGAAPARPLRDWGTERCVEWTKEVMRWAMAVPDVRFCQSALIWSEDERHYLNTAGANCFQRSSRAYGVVVPVAAENGKSEFNAESVGSQGGAEALNGFDESLVTRTAELARQLLRAGKPPSGRMNVILDPGTSGTFAHESFGHGTEADQFLRDRTYLKPLLGQVVGPESLTIVDDGSVPGGWGSIAFDDEGHPGHRTLLIDHGRFVGALHDRETAAAFGTKPTANTRRSDFLSRAFVRMTNTIVEASDWNLDELVTEAGDGVILERWQSGMEDPLGGRMQLKVRLGHRIEHGKVTDLVGPMALSGSVVEFLRDIRGVGNDRLELSPGMCGKGHGDYLPVGGGGAYLLSRAVVGAS